MNQSALASESQAFSHADEMTMILGALAQLKRGDAKARLPYQGAGAFAKVAEVFNDLVEQSATMAEELARMSQVVGKEGKLKKRAALPNAHGFWAESVDCINSLIEDLVHPTSEVARVIGAVAQGDLSKSMALELDGRPLEGEFLRTAKTINKMVAQLGNFSAEVTRVAREVGTEGKLGGQADVQGVAGTWRDLTDSVNSMAGNLTGQVRNIADVTKAVAAGDLSKKITVDVKGEILELKNTINTMVDQLSSFASEVTRVAREVGTEGRLGGQAEVRGVSGVWKDLTDNVNFMAGNLTSQVRGIAKVVTAVANGDLGQKLTVEAKGEMAALAETINSMTDTLATFADQVTTVAREVGVEGKLGGQAKVPGAAGIWKGLTENVNELAANLTTQVRAIAEVATAVTQGDLTRSIAVETQGEVAALKDTINEMIRNLKDTTQKNLKREMARTKEAEEKLQRANRRKDEFLAMLSHELRNPLAPIRNAAEVMRRLAPADPGIAWAREVVERQVTHLGKLVDDLLDVSRITQGKITLKKEPVELGRVIQHSVDTARALLDSKKHNLVLNLPSTAIWVHGDFARLSQVIGNLLNNGAKYTAEGGVIELSATADRGEALITVRDNGIGIDGALLPHVFELFTQGERSLDRSQGGLGVGLTVVQRLVELHQGRVEVRSDGIDKGALFKVVLPCISEVTQAQPDAQKPEAAAAGGKRVLVVDDNIDAAESIAVCLRLEGHEVRTVVDGAQAVAISQVFAPQVAVVDIGLPGMNGYEVARRLRHQEAGPPALLIALTGYGQKEDRARSQEAGFHHHFVKPADPRIIQSAIIGSAAQSDAAVHASVR